MALGLFINERGSVDGRPIEIRVRHGEAASLLKEAPAAGSILLAWLGQAGFALRTSEALMLIDPYLSDSLAEKYHGCEFPHRRMMPPPIAPHQIVSADWVLCTHRHGDHMDPGTLPAIAEASPRCRFLVPAAEKARAVEIGLPETRITGIDAGGSRLLADRMEVAALPSAHETLQFDEHRRCRHLGYVLRIGGMALYHSGDTVVYAGLAQRLRDAAVQVALLPINGRDDYRRSRGVPGNMTFDEAVSLCREAEVSWLLVHHFAMFDFNTVDEATLRQQAAAIVAPPRCVVPKTNVFYELVWC